MLAFLSAIIPRLGAESPAFTIAQDQFIMRRITRRITRYVNEGRARRLIFVDAESPQRPFLSFDPKEMELNEMSSVSACFSFVIPDSYPRANIRGVIPTDNGFCAAVAQSEQTIAIHECNISTHKWLKLATWSFDGTFTLAPSCDYAVYIVQPNYLMCFCRQSCMAANPPIRLLSTRHGAAIATVHNASIYVIGGYGSSGPSALFEIFQVHREPIQWTCGPPMPEARDVPGIAVIDDEPYSRVFILGGRLLNTVIVYDEKYGTWALAGIIPKEHLSRCLGARASVIRHTIFIHRDARLITYNVDTEVWYTFNPDISRKKCMVAI